MQTQKFGVDAFDALFSKNADFRSYVTEIESAIAEKYNTALWKQWYPKASTFDEGQAIKVIEVIKTASVLLDARTRYSEFTQADHEGVAYYNSGLGDFGKGFFYTLQDKEKLSKLGALLNQNTSIIDGYTDKAINLVEGAYGTLDVMSLQLTSTGEINYTYGMGLRFSQQAPIPVGNKQKAGTLIWTNTEALILDRMRDAEKYVKETLNYKGALKWRWSKAVMDSFLKNKQVIAAVGAYLNNKGIVVQQAWGITIDQYNEWVTTGSNNGYVSRIELVPETYAMNQSINGKSTVNPWNDDVAVLSPDLTDGQTRYAAPTEFSQLEGINGHNVAIMEGGMIAFDNYITQSRYPEWHTDMIITAAPTMEHWNYHVIIDTKTANT